jgi:glycyl-tRNA synthetase beta chain
MPDFLLEIGTEEIPARMIDGAREELARRVSDLLTRERLADAPAVEAISTPRRIAVLARNVAQKQPDVTEQVQGPPVKNAYKDGKPGPAVDAFAKKWNLKPEQIQRVTTPKGEYIAATVTKPGRTASAIFSEALPREINGLYWAKNMYWRPGKTSERFVRPVRWMVSLLGGEIVPVEMSGIVAANKTRGHRILSDTEATVPRADDYTEALRRVKVMTQGERERTIRKSLDAEARKVPGARWREDKELLETVINLTEYPSALLGGFEREFLALPEEVLVTVMRDHQKYFAVEDAQGKLAPYFLAVLNTDSDPDGIIRHGHERVLRARFRDARFFWDTDQKHPLRERVDWLKNVTFQKDLGSYYEKTERVVKLSGLFADELSHAGVTLQYDELMEAARLAKTDLTTELVKEFTELQGIVGGLYAKAQGLPQATADAIYDQYKPASMEDAVPRTPEGAVLSIADKADSIAGMFALGMVPSGSKDPFALRRQANGIVKIIAEHKLPIRITSLFSKAWHEKLTVPSAMTPETTVKRDIRWKPSTGESTITFRGVDPGYVRNVEVFFRERLEFYLRDTLGFAYDVVNAVLGAGSDDVLDAVERAKAVTAVRKTENFEPIAAAFKRIKNIIRQAREKNIAVPDKADTSALQQDEEKKLASDAAAVAKSVATQRADKNYEQALNEISKLRPVVDAFFDKVMVMVDDERLRANRLALLQSLLLDFSTIADFSEIVVSQGTGNREQGTA